MPSLSHILLSNFVLAIRSVRIEGSQASFGRLIEAWFQNLKGQIGNSAADAVATIGHEK